MNCKFIFILGISLALVCACKKEQTKANVSQKGWQTIQISYTSYSSLDETKSQYNGTLTYNADSSLLQYYLMVNDSMLFYNCNDQYGFLNMNSHTITTNISLDDDGLPTGSLVSDLFPLFLGDSAYIFNLQKDSSKNTIQTKTTGNISLTERFTNKGYDMMEGMMKFLSSRDYTCYHRQTHRIYFEFTMVDFSINGMTFTQKDFKKYTYPKDSYPLQEKYDSLIQAATIMAKVKKPLLSSDTVTTVPAFQYYGLDGQMYRSENIKERFVVLEFWYISCVPCLKNMEYLNTLYDKYKQRAVKFLILNDADLNPGKIRRIREKYHLNYELYYKAQNVKELLHVTAHPHSIIYDTRTHKILHKQTGTNSLYKKEMMSVLDSLIRS